MQFSRFKGKTVFLNIWATWCGPCVGEMPSIARLAENPRLKGKNIEFVCVSTDDSTDKVVRFLRGKNWPMTVLHPAIAAAGLPDRGHTGDLHHHARRSHRGGRGRRERLGHAGGRRVSRKGRRREARTRRQSVKSPAGPGG